MLQPRKTLFTYVRKGRNRGKASSNNTVFKWQYGIKALENGLITAKQLDDICILLKRQFTRGSSLQLTVFPCYPTTTKPLGTRMGGGKGLISAWNARVKAGHVIVLVNDIDLSKLKDIVRVVNRKLRIKVGLSIRKNFLYNNK